MKPRDNDWWARQYFEGIREISIEYDKFRVSRDLQYLDRADLINDELNDVYGLGIPFMEAEKWGRAYLDRQPSRATWRLYE